MGSNLKIPVIRVKTPPNAAARLLNQRNDGKIVNRFAHSPET
jgi:hypothetical protein